MKKLNEVYKNWLVVGGIITDITTNISEVPWTKTTDFSKSIDTEYYGNRSGQKVISPLLEGLLIDDEIKGQNRIDLAKTVWNIYGENWKKLYEVLIAEYDPIENYRMVETEHSEGSDSDTTHSTANDTTESEATNNNNNQIYGFNSSQAVNADKQSGSNDSTVTSDTEADTTRTGANENDRTLTRAGNIGVQTTQDMIKKSVDLYDNWNYWNTIFNDIDKILVCGFWEE